jgi:hypothetical protein
MISHTRCQQRRCHGSRSAGIAVRRDEISLPMHENRKFHGGLTSKSVARACLPRHGNSTIDRGSSSPNGLAIKIR